MTRQPAVSVVAPLLDEQDNVAPLVDQVRTALADAGDWELILVDDGSTDRTAEVALRCAAQDGRISVLRLMRRFGQSAALAAGFDRARGRVIVSIDGDLQNDPADIPRLLARLAEGYDLVAGYRVNRPKDRSWIRRAGTAFGNLMARLLTRVPIRDTGCTLRAYDRTVVESLRLYSDLHRFIPALAAALAGARIAELPVQERPRQSGTSKYGLMRVPRVLADLLTLLMVRRYGERPLGLFVLAAVPALLLAAISALFAARSGSAAGFVLWGVAFLFVGLAWFFVALGLVGHLVLQVRHERGGRVGIAMLHEVRP